MQTDNLGGERLGEMIMSLVLTEFNFRPQSEIQFVTMVMSDWRAMVSRCDMIVIRCHLRKE